MKNLSSVALAVCMAFGLTACGGGGGSGGSAQTNADMIEIANPLLDEMKKYTEQEKAVLKALTKEQDKYNATPLKSEDVKKVDENQKFKGLKQEHTSYAGILLHKTQGQEDVKYIIDAKQPVTNKALVVDATYLGSLSITDLDRKDSKSDVLATTDLPISFIVKGSSINGSSTFTEQDKEYTISFKGNDNIKKYKNGIGFEGDVELTEKAQKLGTGTYQGVFAGPKAEELVGYFDITNTAKGAFAAKKEDIEPPKPAARP